MNREQKQNLRAILFHHLDGIAICAPISSLYKKMIIEYILDNESFTIQELLDKFESNAGYLNIALRLLSSQGWLIQNIIQDGLEIKQLLQREGLI